MPDEGRYPRPAVEAVRSFLLLRLGLHLGLRQENSYTSRDAIKRLLPQGSHILRDILATHILANWVYEQASYAISDTPDILQQALRLFSSARKGRVGCHDAKPGLESSLVRSS